MQQLSHCSSLSALKKRPCDQNFVESISAVRLNSANQPPSLPGRVQRPIASFNVLWTLEELDALQFYLYEVAPVAETYDAEAYFWKHLFTQICWNHKCMKNALVAFSLDFRALKTEAELIETPSFFKPLRFYSQALNELLRDAVPVEIILVTTCLFWLSDLFHAHWDQALVHISHGLQLIQETEVRATKRAARLTASQVVIFGYMKPILLTCGRRARIRNARSRKTTRQILVRPQNPENFPSLQIHIVIKHALEAVDAMRTFLDRFLRSELVSNLYQEVRKGLCSAIEDLEQLITRFPSVFNRVDAAEVASNVRYDRVRQRIPSGVLLVPPYGSAY